MILLSSILFIVLFFVIPLELLLVMFSHSLGKGWLSQVLWLTGLNVAAYGIILAIVGATRSAYVHLEGDREAIHKQLKPFLNLRGSKWLNLCGVLLVGGGACFFLYQGLLPFPMVFLFAAILIGLGDVFYKDELLVWKPPLPGPLDIDELKPLQGEREGDISVEFRWKFDPLPGTAEDRSYRETFHFSKEDYESAISITRHDHDFPKYVKDGTVTDVKLLSGWFRMQSMELGLSPIEEAENVVTFVRSIQYEHDTVTHGMDQYSNYPIETLVEADKGSDCEDHAILAAAILDFLGHQVALFFIKLENSAHLALGYYSELAPAGYGANSKTGKYFAYYETVPTHSDRRLGHISEEFLNEVRKAEVWEV